MIPKTEQRKLAAIMFTDMVGYSAMSQRDEALALQLLEEHRRIIRGLLPVHGGREVKTTGDGFLLEFPSALAAVRAAVDFQEALHGRNESCPAERRVQIRIGIHVGDVVMSDGDIHGDGVNIAARLEPLASPGGICVSEDVERQVRNKLSQSFVALGPAELKNIVLPVSVHRVLLPWQPTGPPATSRARIGAVPARWKWIALAALLLVAFGLALWQPWRRGSPSPATSAVRAAASPLQRVKDILAKGTDASRDDLRFAITLSQSAVDKNPENDEAWSLLSLATSNLYENYDRSPERFSAAQSAANSAMNLAPGSAGAKLARARVLTLKSATCAEGIQQLRELASAYPLNPEVLSALGQSLQDQENSGAESLEIFDRLLKLRPDDPVALNGRALALSYLGRGAEAEAVWDDSIRRTRSPTAMLYRFYYLFNDQGDNAEAARLAGQFPADFVYNDMAVRLSSIFWLSQREPAKVLAFAEPFPREFIEDFFVQIPKGYFIGKAHAMAGNAEAAKAAWRRALAAVDRQLAADPDKRNALEYKARLHHLLGEEAESERAVELLRQLGGRNLSSGLAWELGRADEVVSSVERAYTNALAERSLVDSTGPLRPRSTRPDAAAENSRATRLVILRNFLRRAPNLYPGMATPPRVQEILAAIDAELAMSTGGKVAPAPIADQKSVAVLAFANLSDDKQNEYFSDGVSEELLNVLAKVPGLKVSARTSAFYFKGKQVPMAEIAQQLGVAYVVEGSVRKSGEKVRITAQLIKAADGFHVWSDTFTRDLKDVFAVQDEIAGLIGKNLSLKLGVSSASAAVKPEAYRLYFEGREAWNRRDEEGFRQAELLFNRALELEPGFARAHAALADVWSARSFPGSGSFSQRHNPLLERTIAKAAQAVALDKNSAEAHASLGTSLHQGWHFEESLRELRRAVELNPNYASAHQWLGATLLSLGCLEEGKASLARAAELDPLSHRILDNYANALAASGRLTEALAVLERARALRPSGVQIRCKQVLMLTRLGRRDEALSAARALAADQGAERPDYRYSVAVFALATFGETREADVWLKQIAPDSEDRPMALASAGRFAEFIQELDNLSVNALHYVWFEPRFAPVRSDPTFREWTRKVGLADALARAEAWHAAQPPEAARTK